MVAFYMHSFEGTHETHGALIVPTTGPRLLQTCKWLLAMSFPQVAGRYFMHLRCAARFRTDDVNFLMALSCRTAATRPEP